MASTLLLSSADRLDAGAPLPGRSTASASQNGPSFADLLQRGQAAHGAPAADSSPSQGDARPSQDVTSEHSDAAPAGPPAQAADQAARGRARPAQQAREKATASTSATRASTPASAETAANEAISDRLAADDSHGGQPPDTTPLADLQAWMASLTAPEPLPAPSSRAAVPDLLAAAAGAVGPRTASAADAPALATDARALVSADGAALPMGADGAALLTPTDSAAVPGLAGAAAALEPADAAAALAPMDRVTSLKRADGAAAPQLAPGTTALKPTNGAALPGSVAGATEPAPIDRRALLEPADRTAARRPVSDAVNGLPGSRSSGDHDDARRSDSAAAMPAARTSAASLDPGALGSAERRPAARDLPAVRDFVQGLVGGATGTVVRGVDLGTLAPIALPAPLHSPEFAQLLGAQVSMLARDGVQQAELRLNPAEMGPINVRISIDDTHARVDFHAAAAATREVIERGLPELASALREQGLTLAGGGVFQQPPDARGQAARDPAGAAGDSRRFVSNHDAGPVRTITIPLPQGALDVYA